MKVTKTTIKRYAAQVDKPILEYGDLLFLKTGHSALVMRVPNHPDKARRKGDGMVRTSIVIKYLGLGCFETFNSIYKPKNPLNYDRTQDEVMAS